MIYYRMERGERGEVERGGWGGRGGVTLYMNYTMPFLLYPGSQFKIGKKAALNCMLSLEHRREMSLPKHWKQITK